MHLLPASPSLAAEGAALPKFATLPNLNDHVVTGEWVAETTEFELCDDDRTL
jgi:hypothetical protein